MQVLDLPFSRTLAIKPATIDGFLLQLDFSPQVVNHIGTIHAAASFALAETTSGYFLQFNFADIASQTIPLLRASKVKYTRGATDDLFSRAVLRGTTVDEVLEILTSRKKVQLTIDVSLHHQSEQLVMQASFDWFITLQKA
jgi:acyl-coenzyme A thioesterase PaaI-like protein